MCACVCAFVASDCVSSSLSPLTLLCHMSVLFFFFFSLFPLLFLVFLTSLLPFRSSSPNDRCHTAPACHLCSRMFHWRFVPGRRLALLVALAPGNQRLCSQQQPQQPQQQ